MYDVFECLTYSLRYCSHSTRFLNFMIGLGCFLSNVVGGEGSKVTVLGDGVRVRNLALIFAQIYSIGFINNLVTQQATNYLRESRKLLFHTGKRPEFFAKKTRGKTGRYCVYQERSQSMTNCCTSCFLARLVACPKRWEPKIATCGIADAEKHHL